MKSNSRKKWTVMVYLAGDNDLNDDMIGSLKSLHALRGNPGCNIFAYYATSNLPLEAVLYDFREREADDAPLEAFATPNLGTAACAAEMGNSADRRTLVNFVRGCRELAETEHNVLILSAHSDGFLGRSLLKDETSMMVMSFKELERALCDVKDVLEGKLDILGFDSCVMGMVEIAYELRDFTRVLVAPQDFTPASGWNYQEMLCSLVHDHPHDDPAVHAKSFVREYVCFQRDFTVGGRSVEIGACRLDGDFEGLIANVARLADLLRVELPPVKPPKKNPPKDGNYGDDTVGGKTRGFVYTRLIELLLCSHWFSQTHMQDQSVDLSHFCFNLFLECQKLMDHIHLIRGVRAAEGDQEDQENREDHCDHGNPEVDRLLTKLNDICDLCVQIYRIMRKDGIVIHNDHAGNQDQFSLGLSLFFPWSRLGFVLSYDTYKHLAFTKGRGRSWLSLINRITVETQRQDIGKFKEKLRRAGFPAPVPGVEMTIDEHLLNEFFEPSLTEDFERYDPPGKGALAAFRERFGKVKNYPMKDLNPPKCSKTPGADCNPKEE